MSGCTRCAARGGCEDRKATERELLGRLLSALYPTRRFGVPDDAARFQGGVSAREGRRIARRAAERLEAPSYHRPGSEADGCDFVYVLCVGREPSLYELRDAPALDVPDVERIREKYLRLALSASARLAAIQEVSFELDRDGDFYVVRERPLAGVYDPILLSRTQRLVDLVVQAGVTYLDFALLLAPPEAYDGGVWDHSGYDAEPGRAPGVWSYLFSSVPATALSSTFVPRAVPRAPGDTG